MKGKGTVQRLKQASISYTEHQNKQHRFPSPAAKTTQGEKDSRKGSTKGREKIMNPKNQVN
jgi:hypothetical protein